MAHDFSHESKHALQVCAWLPELLTSQGTLVCYFMQSTEPTQPRPPAQLEIKEKGEQLALAGAALQDLE